jgi:hypothetical protein
MRNEVMVRLPDGVIRYLLVEYSKGCNGTYEYAGQRNSRPCYTRTNGDGAFYFDRLYWRISPKGNGLEEVDWRYSQLPNVGTEIPLGFWCGILNAPDEKKIRYNLLVSAK